MIKLNNTCKFILAGILLLGALTLIGCSQSWQPLRMGEPVPNFKLQDINDNTVTLSSYKGKIVLLHFWDSTFEPCTAELPFFQALYNEWAESGKAVLLTIDPSEGKSAVSGFMQNYKYTFPVLLDTDSKIAGKYNVMYIPTNILIDKDGKLSLKVEGPFKDKAAIDKQLAAFLP